MPKPLLREFYARDTLVVAQDLLGKVLVRRLGEAVLKGLIVEVEAYRGRDDPASHAYRGLTERNKVMFGEPGVAYVYFTYGNHYCLNVVTEGEGSPAAVLIRALEPLQGVRVMMMNRGVSDILNLTTGPGKLTKAFSITSKQNSLDLTTERELYLEHREPPLFFTIARSKRIGVREGLDKPWRFYIERNPFVSRKQP